MKAPKVRELDGAELQKQVGETNEQLFRLRLQLNMGQMVRELERLVPSNGGVTVLVDVARCERLRRSQ